MALSIITRPDRAFTSKTPNSQFVYKKLSDPKAMTRILTIAPSIDLSSLSPLECTLKDAPLTHANTYQALSYAWGAEEASIPLNVNGSSLLIRPNLNSALLALRYVSSPRTLWVDAICINQEDDFEKEQQVAAMKLIFARATCVLIWLCDHNESIIQAFDYIKSRANYDERAITRYRGPYSRSPGPPSLDFSTVPLNDSSARDIGLRFVLTTVSEMIFNQKWWSRIWVIQEVAVSSFAILKCGTFSLPWSNFAAFLEQFQFSGIPVEIQDIRYSKTAFQSIEATRHLILSNSQMPVLECLLTFQHFLATDPRDKVFALLGLARGDSMGLLNAFLAPNYRATPKQIFLATVQYCITVTESLDILAAAGLHVSPPLDEIEPWPSWIPRWDKAQPPWSLCDRPYQSIILNRISKQRASVRNMDSRRLPCANLDHTLSCLEVKCIFITEVVHIQPAQEFSDSSAYIIESLELLLENTKDQHIYSLIHRMKTFWEYNRGLQDTKRSSSNVKHKQNSIIYSSFPDVCSIFYHTMTAGFYTSRDHDIEDLVSITLRRLRPRASEAPKVYEFLFEIEQYLHHRIFATTSNTCLGLLPSSAQPGDQICVVGGCAVPVVLRRVNGADRYRLIGECYVRNYMSTEEFFSGNEDKGIIIGLV